MDRHCVLRGCYLFISISTLMSCAILVSSDTTDETSSVTVNPTQSDFLSLSLEDRRQFYRDIFKREPESHPEENLAIVRIGLEDQDSQIREFASLLAYRIVYINVLARGRSTLIDEILAKDDMLRERLIENMRDENYDVRRSSFMALYLGYHRVSDVSSDLVGHFFWEPNATNRAKLIRVILSGEVNLPTNEVVLNALEDGDKGVRYWTKHEIAQSQPESLLEDLIERFPKLRVERKIDYLDALESYELSEFNAHRERLSVLSRQEEDGSIKMRIEGLLSAITEEGGEYENSSVDEKKEM